MGSQLAKSDSQHQTTSGRSSHQAGHFLRRAQEAKSLSSASTGSSSISSDRSAKTSSIVVVNSGPSNSSAGQPHKRLPQLQRPLIPIGQIQVNPSFLHLSPQPIIDLGLEIEQELRKNAELVAHEQTKLVEKIRDIDSQVTASSVTIGAERQRRFNKAVDNFGKFDEIDALIQRCENDIENILTVFVQLNDALPDSLCLEQFALQV